MTTKDAQVAATHARGSCALRRVLTAASVAALAATLAAMAAQQPEATHAAGRAQVALPAECVTKTTVEPLVIPSWVFVLNFEVFQGGQPVGCMLVFRAPRVASDAVPVRCIAVAPGISFGGGLGNFDGGHVRCSIDVNAAFASLTPPIVQDKPSYAYPFFTIVAVGRLAATAITAEPYSNPIVHYAPSDPGAPDLGFYVPLSNTPSVAVLTSAFNGITNTGKVPVQLAAGVGGQSWAVKHVGVGDVYTITHAYNGQVVESFAPRGPVAFWTAGGTFHIGASPYGSPFRGALDEVVIDPPDGGIPPLRVPIVMR